MLVLVSAFLVSPAFAEKKCEGPPELCEQIIQLRENLEKQKAINAETELSKIKDEEKLAQIKEKQKQKEDKTIKFIGVMSTIAVALKILLGFLTRWKDSLFQSDKGKATIRIVILLFTILIFLTTNMGFGISWWESLILAAGGPLSMSLHEMLKLVPVVRGNKKLSEIENQEPDQPKPLA
jgi:hypothetical protein